MIMTMTFLVMLFAMGVGYYTNHQLMKTNRYLLKVNLQLIDDNHYLTECLDKAKVVYSLSAKHVKPKPPVEAADES